MGTRMTDRPKAGRPLGSTQSDEARAKISRARRAAVTNSAPMPTAPAEMDYKTVKLIVGRDRDYCRGCHEPRYKWVEIKVDGSKKKVKRIVPGFAVHKIGTGPVDPTDETQHALFCDFCRHNVASQFKSIDDLPPRRGG